MLRASERQGLFSAVVIKDCKVTMEQPSALILKFDLLPLRSDRYIIPVTQRSDPHTCRPTYQWLIRYSFIHHISMSDSTGMNSVPKSTPIYKLNEVVVSSLRQGDHRTC